MTFGEDDCRVRQGHAAQKFATIRHLALNLLKNETCVKRGLQGKRQRADWDHRYLAKILTVGDK